MNAFQSAPAHQREAASVPSVRAVERAVTILRAFTPQRPRLGLTDIADAVGLDKGTTRRLLLTLVENGMVALDPVRKTYALDISVLEIASAVADARGFREAAAPILAALANETRMTAFLSVVRNDAALCLERVNGMPELEINWWPVGGRIPLNCGSGPRVLLAHLPEAAFEAVIASKIEGRTAMSEVAPDQLRRSRDRIRARGWELAVDDFVLGIAGVGVPVRNREGAVVAALSVSSLSPRVAANPEEPACLSALLGAAERLQHAAHLA